MSRKIIIFLIVLASPFLIWSQKNGSNYRFKQAPMYKPNKVNVPKNKPAPGDVKRNPTVEAFESILNTTVVLRNQEGTIPFMGLDTLRLAYLPLGLKADSEFEVYLKKYTTITTLRLPDNNIGKEAIAWATAMKGQYDAVIIGIEDRLGQNKLYLKKHFYINAVIQNFRCATVVFGGAEIFQFLPTVKQSEALLVAPDQLEYSEPIAAQSLFGAWNLYNRLPGNLSADITRGQGTFVQGVERLGYCPPEMVGMNSKSLADSIARIVKWGIEKGAYPGAQVLVARRSKVVYHQAFGHQTYNQKIPLTTSDIYDFASLTKVTAALPALMRFYGKGQFDLDAPLKAYFPKFKKSNKADLTFRAMLAHHARLKPWIPYWRSTIKKNGKFRAFTFKRDSSRRFPIRVTDDLWLHRNYKKKIYKAIEKSPLNEEPGFVYSGLLFYLLPEIVAEMAGEDFETHLKRTFYKPLGAHTITFNAYKHFPLEKIIPTENDTFFRMTQLHGTVHDEGAAMMGGVSANAGLFGNANDLAKLLQLYLNEGKYGGQQFIAPDAIKEFTRCQYCEEDNHRGLGFDKPQPFNKEKQYTADSASPQSFGHSGYTGTFAWVDPQEELIVVFFSNRVYPSRDNRKLYELNIRKALHQAVYDAID